MKAFRTGAGQLVFVPCRADRFYRSGLFGERWVLGGPGPPEASCRVGRCGGEPVVMECVECDHADHAEAATMMQTLTQRLPRKDFLVDAGKVLVDAPANRLLRASGMVAGAPFAM